MSGVCSYSSTECRRLFGDDLTLVTGVFYNTKKIPGKMNLNSTLWIFSLYLLVLHSYRLYSHRHQWSNLLKIQFTYNDQHSYIYTQMELWAHILSFEMYCTWIPNTKFKPTLEEISVVGDGLGRSKRIK